MTPESHNMGPTIGVMSIWYWMNTGILKYQCGQAYNYTTAVLSVLQWSFLDHTYMSTSEKEDVRGLALTSELGE